MSNLANQPAFPGISDSRAGADSYNNLYTAFEAIPGMTLLQWYAGEAMKGLLAAPPEGLMMSAPKIAAYAVEQAKALLIELEKPRP